MTAASGPNAPTMSSVVRRILAQEGVLGLWAGLGPNVARTFLVNAAELGTCALLGRLTPNLLHRPM